jgi:hypothetical protein
MILKICLWAVVTCLAFTTLSCAHAPSEQPTSDKVIADAIEREVLDKSTMINYCPARTIISNRFKIKSIKVVDFNEADNYGMVEAELQCVEGPVTSPHIVDSFEFFKLSKDNQGVWKAELVTNK